MIGYNSIFEGSYWRSERVRISLKVKLFRHLIDSESGDDVSWTRHAHRIDGLPPTKHSKTVTDSQLVRPSHDIMSTK